MTINTYKLSQTHQEIEKDKKNSMLKLKIDIILSFLFGFIILTTYLAFLNGSFDYNDIAVYGFASFISAFFAVKGARSMLDFGGSFKYPFLIVYTIVIGYLFIFVFKALITHPI